MFSAFISGCVSGANQAAMNNLVPNQQVRGALNLRPTDQKTQQATAKVLSNDTTRLVALCPHNGRGDTTVADIVEHIGNQELGSAARDAIESDAGQAVVDAVVEAVEAIGNEAMRVGD